MEHVIYVVLFSILGAIGYVIYRRERKKSAVLKKEKSEIEGEERRMFDFLHGLGETLQEDNSPANMHRYIVDGVAGVVSGDAGILYLFDGETKHLVPVFQSEETAPVIPVPTEILDIKDADDAAIRYRSFIRLSALERENSMLGRVMEDLEQLHIPNLSLDPEFSGGVGSFHDRVSLLAAPLVYGQRRVGVLAITRNGDGNGFSKNDIEVFESIAEQSSFALGGAIIHSDAAEKRRLERELNQASEIQRLLLPQESPDLSDYDVAADYRAARILSGDYYDYIRVDEDRYGFVVGDVCGKGVAASLIMAMCRSNLRSRAPDNLSPASVLHAVNKSICPDIKEDKFVSLLYMIAERGSDEITLARAGHEPPILYRKETGEIEMIEPPGLAAGIDEGPVFKRIVKDHRFKIYSGDILLLYTDGIVESENSDGDEFGLERLCELVKTNHERSASELVEAIIDDISGFSEGMAQIDDITLIAIEKR